MNHDDIVGKWFVIHEIRGRVEFDYFIKIIGRSNYNPSFIDDPMLDYYTVFGLSPVKVAGGWTNVNNGVSYLFCAIFRGWGGWSPSHHDLITTNTDWLEKELLKFRMIHTIET